MAIELEQKAAKLPTVGETITSLDSEASLNSDMDIVSLYFKVHASH
jgi:hypothetical protein